MTDADQTSHGGSPIRRRWLLGGAAAAATLAGIAVSRWHTGPTAPAFVDVQEPVHGFWSHIWTTPGGATIGMAAFKGKPLLLNFWATWCPPCVDELPLIDAFYLKNKANGWQVLALAIDRMAPVEAFLAKLPLQAPVAIGGALGSDLGRSLGNLAGGLPFTVVIGADGTVRQRKMGRVTETDLAQWVELK